MNINVGIADMKVSDDPGVTLVTHSLGSCIGLAVYDSVAKVGGMLHYMLPESELDTKKAKTRPLMFADTGAREVMFDFEGQLLKVAVVTSNK